MLFEALVEEADELAQWGVTDAPVGDGFRKEGFDTRVFLRIFCACERKGKFHRLAVVEIVLQQVEGAKVGAAAEANVSHEGVAWSEA